MLQMPPDYNPILLFIKVEGTRMLSHSVYQIKIKSLNTASTAQPNHTISPDKNDVQNCYRHLEVGGCYVIREWKTGRFSTYEDKEGNTRRVNQVVYHSCVPLSQPEIRKVIAFHTKNGRNNQRTWEFAQCLNSPPDAPDVADILGDDFT